MTKGYYCPWCNKISRSAELCHGKICCIDCGKPIDSRFAHLLGKTRLYYRFKVKEAVNVRELAQYLGTSATWAGQVMRELGWTRNAYYGGYPTYYTAPRESENDE